MSRLLRVIALLPALAGCGHLPTLAPVADVGPTQPVYCYRSLADVDCYLVEDRERPGQLVGIWSRPIVVAEGAPQPLR